MAWRLRAGHARAKLDLRLESRHETSVRLEQYQVGGPCGYPPLLLCAYHSARDWIVVRLPSFGSHMNFMPVATSATLTRRTRVGNIPLDWIGSTFGGVHFFRKVGNAMP